MIINFPYILLVIIRRVCNKFLFLNFYYILKNGTTFGNKIGYNMRDTKGKRIKENHPRIPIKREKGETSNRIGIMCKHSRGV